MRAFDDVDVIHVEERVDPVADIEIITNELRLKARLRVLVGCAVWLWAPRTF